MKSWLTRIAGFLALLCVLAAPAVAHHARSDYDLSRTITLKATVTRLDWTNPHALIFFDVNDENGHAENWHAITGAPSRLSRQGWTSDTLKPGDQITITGNPTKTGTHDIWMTRIVTADGRELGMRR